MATLRDVRRMFPPEDAEAYARAYAIAGVVGDLGALLHARRVAAGLSVAELARRMGVDEEEIRRAEEGDASLTVALAGGVARATRARVRRTVSAGDHNVAVLGTSGPPPPPSPPRQPGA
jgi:ribosome-binding protein aMBF1 (putative translation factor)